MTGLEKNSFLELVAEVEGRRVLQDPTDHGPHHWRLVAKVGSELLPTVPEGDPLILLLFALFHDSQRQNEFTDPDHGRRGAALAEQLLPGRVPGLDGERRGVLTEACALHADGVPTDDPRIGLCWDADRLNLWRVGTRPDPNRMFTSEAKKPERIAWADELQSMDYTWAEIWDVYEQPNV